MILTYEQAKRYIGGEQFDAKQHRIYHVKMLYRSGIDALERMNTKIKLDNFEKTVSHWIENNKNVENVSLLCGLLETIKTKGAKYT